MHFQLVGHTIPAGGVAITGQEQTQTGGGFSEGIGMSNSISKYTNYKFPSKRSLQELEEC